MALFETRKIPYYTTVLRKKWIVLQNVFSPKYSKDAEYFCKWLPNLKSKTFLEIGSGTGIIAIQAALRGARKVIAIDINPDAVKNTKINAKRMKVNIDARLGSLFSSIKKGEKFDIIFFNIPFGYRSQKQTKLIEMSVWDYKYKTQEKFLKSAKKHLSENGQILLGFSTIGHVSILRKNIKKYGYIKEIGRKSVDDIEGKHTYILYKITPSS